MKANQKCQSNDVTTFKKDINKDTLTGLKNFSKNTAWTDVLSNKNASEAYDPFLSKFTDLY